jgi:hypothetical protein
LSLADADRRVFAKSYKDLLASGVGRHHRHVLVPAGVIRSRNPRSPPGSNSRFFAAAASRALAESQCPLVAPEPSVYLHI